MRVKSENTVQKYKQVCKLSPHKSKLYLLMLKGGGRGWSLSQLTLDERRVTSWTDCQSATGLTHRDREAFMHIFTPSGNSPINLTTLWEEMWSKATQEQGEQPAIILMQYSNTRTRLFPVPVWLYSTFPPIVWLG